MLFNNMGGNWLWCECFDGGCGQEQSRNRHAGLQRYPQPGRVQNRTSGSGGTLAIRDTANQQQDVADLSRDTTHANDSLSPIFDKEKEQKRLQAVSLISEIGS